MTPAGVTRKRSLPQQSVPNQALYRKRPELSRVPRPPMNQDRSSDAKDLEVSSAPDVGERSPSRLKEVLARDAFEDGKVLTR